MEHRRPHLYHTRSLTALSRGCVVFWAIDRSGADSCPSDAMTRLYPLSRSVDRMDMRRKSRSSKRGNRGGRWIQRAIKRPGAFRAKAKARGMTTAQFASRVLANPSEYDQRTVRQASLAKTLSKMRKKR